MRRREEREEGKKQRGTGSGMGMETLLGGQVFYRV
jgi:hypothetical protein